MKQKGLKKKWITRRIAVMLAVFIAVFTVVPAGFSFFGTDASATINEPGDLPATATGANKTGISNATVALSDNYDGTTDVYHWDDVGFTSTFSVNPGTTKNVSPGDYIIVDWPDAGNGNAAITPHKNDFPLTEERDGKTVTYANAYVTEKGAVIVFTDAVNNYYDINGYVDIWGQVR